MSAPETAERGAKKRTVIVRKKIIEDKPPEYEPKPPKKKVILVRKVRPGETIQLQTNAGETIAYPKDGDIDHYELLPESVARRIPVHTDGPKRDKEGKILPRHILGDPEEFEQMRLLAEDTSGSVEKENLPKDLESNLDESQNYLDPSDLASSYRPRVTRKDILKDALQTLKASTQKEHDEKLQLLKSMHVNERTKLLKEERSLARYNEFSTEWEKFKTRISKRLGKSGEDLVISRAQEYREMMEELELFQRALPMHVKHQAHQWEMSLRDGHTRFVRLGNSVTGLWFPISEKTKQPIEFVRNTLAPSTVNTNSLRSMLRTWTQRSDYLKKRHQAFGREMKRVVTTRPDFDGLLVSGQGFEARLEEMMKEATRAAEEGIQEMEEVPVPHEEHIIEVQDAASEARSAGQAGPALQCDVDRIALQCGVLDLVASSLTVHNVGTTALYYAWTEAKKPRLPATTCDGIERFYLDNVSGVILPDSSHTFHFEFRSPNAGIFTSTWELRTVPPTPNSPHIVTIKGVATTSDTTSLQRRQLEEHLARNQTVHAVEDILGDMIRNVRTPDKPRPTPPPQENSALLEQLFNTQNRALKLFFHAHIFQDLNELATSTFHLLNFSPEDSNWDCSVASLGELILQIPDEEQRDAHLKDLNECVRLASVPPSSTSLFFAIGYELLVDVAERVPDIAASCRSHLGLPEREFVPPAEDVDAAAELVGRRKGGGRRTPSAPEDDKKGRARTPQAATRADAKGAKDKDKEKDKEKDKKGEASGKPAATVRRMAPLPAPNDRASKSPPQGARRPVTPDHAAPHDQADEALDAAAEVHRQQELQYRSLLMSRLVDVVADAMERFDLLCSEADARSQQLAQAEFDRARPS